MVVCDDARKEVTGKDILVGVYGGGIHTPQLPVSINLSFWLEITVRKPGRLAVDIKVECPGDNDPVMLQLGGDVLNPNEAFSVFTPQLGYAIARSGHLKLFIKASNKEGWTLLKQVPITHVPLPAPPL